MTAALGPSSHASPLPPAPSQSGQVATLFYRRDVLAAANLTVPNTW
jgi:hypothetical protein